MTTERCYDCGIILVPGEFGLCKICREYPEADYSFRYPEHPSEVGEEAEDDLSDMYEDDQGPES